MRPIAAHLGRAALAATTALALTAAVAGTVFAHPLGNFTINHYAGLRVGPTSIAVDWVLDMAEIPTFQERQRIDTNADGVVDAAETEAERQVACARTATDVHLTVGETRLPLVTTAAGLSFPLGTSGLETMRLVCEFSAQLAGPLAADTKIAYRDDTWVDRIGWREITAVGDGTTLRVAGVPTTSVSSRLTVYPQDLLTSPLAMTSASFAASPGGRPAPPFSAPDAEPLTAAGPGTAGGGGGVVATAAPAATAALVPVGVIPGGVTDQISGLLQTQDLTPLAILGSLLVAAFLGALHAVSPGHGKTVMAAYLVGARGSAKHAIALGITVTISHTLGVLTLALITLYASSLIPPERLFPLLGVASGALVIGIGLWLLYGRYRLLARNRAHQRAHAAEAPHDHGPANDNAHGHGREHAHDPLGAPTAAAPRLRLRPDYGFAHAAGPGATISATSALPAAPLHSPTPTVAPGEHSHGGFRHSHLPPTGADLTWRSLFSLGLAGGLVPSASALLLLLGSLAANRPAYGLVLVLAFGAGMAIVLAGVGLLLVYATRFAGRIPTGARVGRLWDLLPVATAVVVIAAGVYLTSQAFTQVF